MTRPTRLTLGVAVLALAGAGAYMSTLKGASNLIDSSRLATVELGTMARSVVATGKVEPITKVEIKSKANGIIERLAFDLISTLVMGSILPVATTDRVIVPSSTVASRDGSMRFDAPFSVEM